MKTQQQSQIPPVIQPAPAKPAPRVEPLDTELGFNGPGSNGPGSNGPGSNGPGSNGPGSNGLGLQLLPGVMLVASAMMLLASLGIRLSDMLPGRGGSAFALSSRAVPRQTKSSPRHESRGECFGDYDSHFSPTRAPATLNSLAISGSNGRYDVDVTFESHGRLQRRRLCGSLASIERQARNLSPAIADYIVRSLH